MTGLFVLIWQEQWQVHAKDEEDKVKIPKILLDGELRRYNDYVITSLGTPVFLVTPESTRPHTKDNDPVGLLYEVVTGLYAVWHDYGDQLFKAFREYFAPKNRLISLHDHNTS